MSADQEVKVDERTVAVAGAGSRRALNFVSFAILIDIIYRAAVWNEVAWDLWALLGVSVVSSTAYLARHKVLGQLLSTKLVILAGVGALVLGAVIAVILTICKLHPS